MGKIILSLLPLLMELKSMTQTTSNIAHDTAFAVKNVKDTLRGLIATLSTAIILSGIVIFATIRLIQGFEIFARTYEGGENFLLGLYALLVAVGVGFIIYLIKPTSKKIEDTPPLHTQPSAGSIESILGALVTGFFEGMQKEQATCEKRSQTEDKGPTYNETH